jgi:hypothetical protein
MWISLFTIVLAIALSLGIGAVILETNQNEKTRRYARKRLVRSRG